MRKARVVLAGFPHHIILRGNNRRRLFSYPSDYRAFLRYLADGLRRHAVELHNFCLMRNHVHLLATPEHEVSLRGWVKHFAQRYAIRWNRAHKGSGKLFEERFKSFPIRTESYFEACTSYIELNPIRAGLVLLPEAYAWSSYHLHAGQPSRSPLPTWAWKPSALYLAMGRTATERGAAFVRWLHGTMGKPLDLPADHSRAATQAEALSTAAFSGRIERPNGARAI